MFFFLFFFASVAVGNFFFLHQWINRSAEWICSLPFFFLSFFKASIEINFHYSLFNTCSVYNKANWNTFFFAKLFFLCFFCLIVVLLSMHSLAITRSSMQTEWSKREKKYLTLNEKKKKIEKSWFCWVNQTVKQWFN